MNIMEKNTPELKLIRILMNSLYQMVKTMEMEIMFGLKLNPLYG